ncbi:MAG: PBP1A family penicillin-binding protein [Rhodobacteraceae bacterium]|nr:PBP1A family penicillin-binding protein [Paracoccaceae bacterium]
MRFFGFIFAWLSLGLVMSGIGLMGVLWMYSRDLPDLDQLRNYTPAVLSRVYSSDGYVLDEFVRERRIYTPTDEIPDIVKFAFISAEDKNFYDHPGYDVRGMASALLTAVTSRGAKVRGASTITQQVMKNFLLDGSREIDRKIKEIILATRVEQVLTKDDILALYMNDVFLGQSSYGVTAAAANYFGKSLEELSIAEAAFLAIHLKDPNDYHPVRNRKKAIERRAFVLREMNQNGYITDEEYQTALADPLLSVQAGDFVSGRDQIPPRGYFTDEIRRQLNERIGPEQLFGGGLAIRATVDPELQAVAAQALRDRLEEYDRKLEVYWGAYAEIPPEELAEAGGWQDALRSRNLPRDIPEWKLAVVLSLDEGSARVGVEGVGEAELTVREARWARPRQENGSPGARPDVASDIWAVGDVVFVKAILKEDSEELDYWSLRQIPGVQGAFVAMDPQTGRVLAMQGGFSYQSSSFNRATQAERQPGSAFKPFVYASALDNGYTPASIVVDAPIEVNTGDGVWRPQNASKRFYGPAPMRTGIVSSRNLMTVRIAQDIGMDVVAAYAERFGVYDNMPEHLSYALGAGETTLYKMVTAYSMFANGGTRVEPTLVDRVQDRNGNTILRHDPRSCVGCSGPELVTDMEPWVRDYAPRIMDPVTAYQLSSMMRGVVARGTAASTVGRLGVPISGKTGTTNEAKDAWFVGFTPQIAAGCYIGYDTPTPMGRGAYGGSMCGPVFVEFMEAFLPRHGSFEYPQPGGTVFVKIDRYTGERLPDGASGDNVVTELFRAGEEPAYGAYGEFVDGGFTMGRDLLFFGRGEADNQTIEVNGREVVLPPKSTFGGLSAGDEY